MPQQRCTAMQASRSRAVRRVITVVAAIGAVHFLFALAAWGMGLWAASQRFKSFQAIEWSAFWPALISVLLLPVFVASLLFASNRIRLSACFLVIGLLVSVCAFGFETRRDRYQIQMLTKDGCVHVYFNWWWWRHDR